MPPFLPIMIFFGITTMIGLGIYAEAIEKGNVQKIEEFLATKARAHPKMVNRIENNLRRGVYSKEKAEYIAEKLNQFKRRHG